jgi:two-component system nitrate/nitrite response regulator NarL
VIVRSETRSRTVEKTTLDQGVARRPDRPPGSPPKHEATQRWRVLLVDDHPLLLDVLNRFLTEVSGIEIVARASDGLEAISLAILHQPDLVLTNLVLPSLGGLELTRYLAAQPRAPRVVLMSFHDESEYRQAAAAAGAAGFILQQELGTKLVPMIESLMNE